MLSVTGTPREGFVNPRIVKDEDWRRTLYSDFASGCYMLLTGPIAIVLTTLLAVIVGRDLWQWIRRA